MLLILLFLVLGWAVIATMMVIRNPFPFPDRGHRLFGVPDDRARETVLSILKQAGLSGRFRFKTGPSDQTILWDNTTVIHILNQPDGPTGTGISLVVKDPGLAAQKAISALTNAGFTAARISQEDVSGMNSQHLVVISSDAFLGWAMAFRRHQLRMPKPKFESPE
jgi:hypothetical protein